MWTNEDTALVVLFGAVGALTTAGYLFLLWLWE